MRFSNTQLWPILLAPAFFAACSGEKTATEYLQSATTHMESGDMKAALIETRNAVSLAPEDKVARLQLGNLELQLGNPAGAEGALLKAIELGTPEEEIAAKLADAFYFQGKFDELEKIDMLKLETHEKARVLGYQAEVALSEGNLSQAHSLAEDALRMNPLSTVALTISARLQFFERNVPRARTYLTSVLDATPPYSPAWELLGDIESSEQRLPEAISAYSKAFESAVNGSSALFKRARTHLALKDYESAAADVDIFKEAASTSPAIGLLKAEILLNQSKLGDAQLALEQSLKNAPDYLPAVRTLAITHLLRGNLGQAEQFGKQYFDIADSDDSRILLAAIRLQAGRLAQAEQTLKPLVDTGRINLLGSQILATTQLKQNKFDEAVNTMLTLKSNLSERGFTAPPPLAMLSNPTNTMSTELLSEDAALESNTNNENYLTWQELQIIEAVEALGSQNIDHALKVTHSLLDKQTDNADLHTLLARIHASSGDKQAASESLATAMELDDTPLTAVILEAMLELEAGEVAISKNLLEDALGRAEGQDRERILLTLATVDASSGNESAVVSQLQQAYNENPSSYQPSLALAMFHARKSESEKVLESLSRLTSTGLQNPAVIELQARAYIQLEQFDDAIALITPMVQAQPATAQWRFLRSKANAGKKDIEAVKQDLDMALKIDPNYPPAKLALANLSVLTNDLPQAEMHLVQLETLIPGSNALSQLSSRVESARERYAQSEAARDSDQPPLNTQEVMERARLHWSAGDQESAIDTLTGWLEDNPEDVTVRLTLANTYTSLNRRNDAVEAFQLVLQTDQDNFIALNNLAWQLREDDPETAIALATRAVELQPNNVSTLDTLAVIQLDQGLLTEAGETFGKIRSLEPTNPTILFHGARIQAALGEKEDAKNILQPLISGNVDFPEAEEAQALFSEL